MTDFTTGAMREFDADEGPSSASACDHVDHVRTQLPYALLVAAVGLVLGDVGTSFGLPVWIALPAGVLVLWAVLRFLGTEVVSEVEAEVEPVGV